MAVSNWQLAKKVLIITYYWPPGGGSGVQRWLYFSKYLTDFAFEPYIITVDEKNASYKFIDESLNEQVQGIKVFKTTTIEPLRFYSRLLSGNEHDAIPQGFAGEKSSGVFQRISRFIRGNFFIPDARRGWNYFAFRTAKQIIESENISFVITTGPPHSTHLIGLKLKKKYNLKWLADFRDPWTEVYYNKLLFRTWLAKFADAQLEKKVLRNADVVLTIGPSMKKLLAEKVAEEKSKFHFIYNGFDEDIFKKLIPAKSRDCFTICHVGILGESQPITSFLEAVKKLFQSNPEASAMIKFKIVGKVSSSIIREINQMVPQLKLEVTEYVPHADAIQQMLNADLLLNSLAETENSELLISGKLMEYVASRTPILCLGNLKGDAADLLRHLEFAIVKARGNVEEIYSYVDLIFSRWRRNLPSENAIGSINNYSRLETARQLAELIHDVSG
ncbi:MAG TPA: glycosyltransferase [Bacteroidia bacterium]|nr:glycosyltransferase [Bacteroidia bacterium]